MKSWLFGAPRALRCPGCCSELQWRRSLHRRILAGGILFRIGLVCGAIAILAPEGHVGFCLQCTMTPLAVLLVLAGTFVTLTRALPLVEVVPSPADSGSELP